MGVSTTRSGGTVQRGGSSGGGLAEILDRILDKGIVIDAWVRISLVGIELITIEARVVVASVDTYLKYAEAIGATELASRPRAMVEAAPSMQQALPPETAQMHPSEDEVMRYLAEHADGLPISDMESHFSVPRSQVEDVVNRLLEENRVRKDDKRQVVMPAS